MNTGRFASIFVILALCAGGCEAFNGETSKKHDKQLKDLSSRTQESAKYTEEQLGRINSRISSTEENCSQLSAKINELQRQVGTLTQQNQALSKQLQQESATLKQQIDAEKQARQTSLDKMADQMGKETASIVNSIRTAQAESIAKQEKENAKQAAAGGPVGTGNFVEYKVQSGATLTAISKAYNVSIDDIRKANNLKSDVLRTGQTLYIPKK